MSKKAKNHSKYFKYCIIQKKMIEIVAKSCKSYN